jgi:TetR/AcrR family transcriptional repressor of nem operon
MGRTSDSRKRLLDAGHELIWSTSYGSVTIDAICERAHVQKGTFYHFFDSKADLAIDIVDRWWNQLAPFVAETFAPSVPPLERISRYIDYTTQKQLNGYQETGRVRGCPMFTLASEICLIDEKIADRIRVILDLASFHFGNTIRDAQALGQIPAGDPLQKTRLLWGFYEGTLTRARIENNPELIRTLGADAMVLLGARTAFLPLESILQTA